MVTDAYDFTDKLLNLITKENKILEVSKELNNIKDNAEKIKFVEKLLLEKNLMPNSEENMRQNKSENLAKHYRDEGNKHYSKLEFFDALECYNKSLCFCENNSENLAIAYANRSAVYCEMKLYSRALSNIEEALKHNYPQKSIDKLKKREELCKNMLKERMQEPSNVPIGIDHLKLSHESNPKIPFIADCLKLKCDENYGRYVITELDLSAGEIVAIESPFSKIVLSGNKYRYCATCLSDNFFDLIPCDECTSTMFCSEKCKEIGYKKFHRFECTIVDRLKEICTKILSISSQTFFEALYILNSDINQLMKATEEAPNVTIFDFDMSNANDEKLKLNQYMAINSLVTNESQRNAGDFFQRCGIVAILTHLFLNFTRLSDLLNTESAKDFYRKFIFKQTQIAALNYHGIFDGVYKTKIISDSTQYGSGSYSFCSLINHSCAPNVVRVSYDCKNFVMVNRPIKAGEQLFDNYGYHHCLEDFHTRQKSLASQYMFHCSCEACKGNYPLFPNLKSVTNTFDDFIGDDVSKLMHLDLDTAEKRFKDYCNIIDKVDKFYPCREVSALQECILQCFFVFKTTSFKLKLMK
ncbi:hypothetical protein PVAND_001284 [Polypedilum vanderplanki]|uniref:SET and MYND domain-containing protein 4-like protein n=1 Tax=Polypedilum vanderplanki TaxID=319348 RepID=A0A9J6BNT0_POLVA|nr:hypothetical protein PVAND_001284 [Polypedilum vanderplanki]